MANQENTLHTVKARWYGEGDLAEIYHIGDKLFFFKKQAHDRFALDSRITYPNASAQAYKVIPFNMEDVPSNAAGSPFI